MLWPSIDTGRLFDAALKVAVQFRAVIAGLIERVSPRPLVFGRAAGDPLYPALRAGVGGEWPVENEAKPREPEPERLSGEQAWSLATRPIVEACSTADQAAGLQAAASQQLDAAVYALERLMADLAPVIRSTQKRAAVVARVSFEAPRDRHTVSMRRTGLMPVRSSRSSSRAA